MKAIPNGGQCVITDLGEGKDIHPRNKQDVAERLVRWALVKQYGKNVPYRSAELKQAEFNGNKAVVTLDTFGQPLTTFDVADVRGLALCGEDKVWHWATGKVVGADKVEVTSPKVTKPIAVRFAWSDNPVANLYAGGLPVTPFRSDDFMMITDPANPANPVAVQNKRMEEIKKQMSARKGAKPGLQVPAPRGEVIKKAVVPAKN